MNIVRTWDIEKNIPIWEAHCKGTFPREFAYKPLPGESPLNLVRIHRFGTLRRLKACECVCKRARVISETLLRSPDTISILDIIIRDNFRINNRFVPDLLRKLELRIIDVRKEEEKKMEAIAVQPEASQAAVKGGKYVTGKEIQTARCYPIASILGNGKLRTCPFHDDQVPSLSVNHEKNLWRCFACGRSGNVIQLVMER